MSTPAVARAATVEERAGLVRRGRWLAWATLAYNSLEGVIAIASGLVAGSVSLVGFGVDSFIELASGGAALWRLHAEHDEARRERAERTAHLAIGVSFLLLAAYVAYEAARALLGREAPSESVAGIIIAAASLVIMPLLARAKRRVAAGLGSGALSADAMQTDICAWLSAILLGGLLLNALLGWWWADPVAGLLMAPLIAREGVEGVRGRPPCADGCHG
ncbi:MAG TPA: cation transporter [Gemmatimonadaceae bacterium]|nr:cation transporter [Gemmatimonadaceae bacterium]